MNKSDLKEHVKSLTDGSSLQFFEPVFENTLRKGAVSVILCYVVLAFIGPVLAPHGPFETQYTEAGQVASVQPPGLEYPLGTTNFGYDIFSQMLYSFRISVFVGAGSAALVVFFGMNIGLVAGYYGGKIDSVIMLVTDIVYGLPLLPFAIVFVSIMGRSDLNVILVIGLLVWRTIARVTRSETLRLRELEFIKGAKAAGTSNFRIMYFHILPNLIPLIVVYFIFGAIWGIMIEASLSFLGLGNPDTMSWGMMLFRVYDQAMFTEAWWWVVGPSLALWVFIVCLYVISRALEENTTGTQRAAT